MVHTACFVININIKYCLISYHLTTGYSEVSSSVESKEIVIMDKVVTCSEGWIRYLLSTALHTDEFTVSDDFYYSVKNLPTSYDEDDYIQFIKNWGTVSYELNY